MVTDTCLAPRFFARRPASLFTLFSEILVDVRNYVIPFGDFRLKFLLSLRMAHILLWSYLEIQHKNSSPPYR